MQTTTEKKVEKGSHRKGGWEIGQGREKNVGKCVAGH